MYIDRGEWSWVSIRESKSRKGYIVETWSRIQGERTGRKVLVSMVAPGIDLRAMYNDTMTKGQWIASLPGRVLRKGSIVQ